MILILLNEIQVKFTYSGLIDFLGERRFPFYQGEKKGIYRSLNPMRLSEDSFNTSSIVKLSGL